MTSATGIDRRGRGAGFTLLEIVLVLGLIVFAAAVVGVNFGAMAERGDRRDATEILRAAVREARFLAAAERRITSLRFDEETGELVVGAGTGEGANGLRFALSDKGEASAVRVRFFLTPASEGLEPPRDPEDARTETEQVRFAPDRSSSPFSVEIDNGAGEPLRLVFDPFSSLLWRAPES
jgi:type II secretory pathway pseudopilin PulG